MPLRRHALHDSGFSLIELLIAVVFIMISMLALLTAIVTSMHSNMQNDLRNTSIRLTNQTAEALLSLPITDPEVAVGAHTRTAGDATQNSKGLPDPVVNIRGLQQTYVIQWTVTAPSANVRESTIMVRYTYRGKETKNESVIYTHRTI